MSEDAPPTDQDTFRTPLLILSFAALLLAPLLLYAPALHGEFVVDDHRFIVRNGENLDLIHEPWKFFTRPETNAEFGDSDIYRPLRTLSFAIDRACFGLDPFGYHVHSVFLHGLVGILLFMLLRKTLRRDGPAWISSALFVCHPLATEAVAWISSRGDLQGAALLLAALLAARRLERGAGAPWIAAALAALACFGKESSVVVPALFLIEHRLRTGRVSRTSLRPFLWLLAGTVGWFCAYVLVRNAGVTGQVPFYGGSFLSHLPYGLAGVATQLKLALAPIAPTGHHYHHEPALYHPADGARLIRTSGFLLCVIGIAWCGRRFAPAVAFGFSWFFVALLPIANLIIPMRTVLAERFAYIPLMGIAMVAAHFVIKLFDSTPRAMARSVVALVLVVTSIATVGRAEDWRSAEALHRASLQFFPESYSANLGLASALELDDPSESALLYASAAKRATDPEARLRAAYGLGHVFLTAGKPTEALVPLRQIDESLSASPGLIAEAPYAAEARYELATAFGQLLRLEESAEVLDRLILIHGETPRFLDARGEIDRARFSSSAMEYYSRALELDPNYHRARIHRALIMMVTPGWEREAENEFQEVLARDPGNADAVRYLAEARVSRQVREKQEREQNGG